jgi:hypothetical protein
MRAKTLGSGLMIFFVALLLIGCQKAEPPAEPATTEEPSAATAVPPVAVAYRGEFGEGSCDSGQRIAVDANAAYAIYLDANGDPLNVSEDLAGTHANQMCPTPEPGGPSGCPTGYCAKTMLGKTYCLRC